MKKLISNNSDHYKLNIYQSLDYINKKKLNLKDFVNSSINRIKKYDSKVKSISSFSKELVSSQVKKIQSKKEIGYLKGALIGVKDVYNTVDFNTNFGSKIYKNFKAGNNARIVDNIFANDGIMLCKTKSAEFSVHEPPNTINPYSKFHMPGTSSTGSAVAVACGFVQAALGTQTAGSTFRPASYNGIYGYKPSFGLFPRTGLLKTTDTLDHSTLLTRSIFDLKILFDCLRVKGENYPMVNLNLQKKKFEDYNNILFFKGYTWDDLEDYTKESFIKFIETLQKKFKINVKELVLPKSFNKIHKSHKIIYNKSLSYYFKNEYLNFEKDLSKSLIYLIEKGNTITNEEFKNELERQIFLQNKYNKMISNSIIISPCTIGEAPKIKYQEKDDLCLFWTYLNVACVSVPLFKGPNKLPYSIIVSSKKYDDYLLFSFLNFLFNNKIIKDSTVVNPNV